MVNAGSKPYLAVRVDRGEAPLTALRAVLEALVND